MGWALTRNQDVVVQVATAVGPEVVLEVDQGQAIGGQPVKTKTCVATHQVVCWVLSPLNLMVTLELLGLKQSLILRL